MKITSFKMADGWTLEQALALVRSIQPACHSFNYHVTLGGGVLNQGFSSKDLDLFFLPFGNTDSPPATEALLIYLAHTLGEVFPLGGFGHDGAATYPDQPVFVNRHTYRTAESKRIDGFIA
jgi:hypothetical protein